MAKLLSIAEIRKMSVEDLRNDIATAKNEAAKVRLGISLSKEKDTSQLPRLRKQIAQMMTVLSGKESSVSSDSSVSSISAQKANKPRKSLSKAKKMNKLPAQA